MLFVILNFNCWLVKIFLSKISLGCRATWNRCIDSSLRFLSSNSSDFKKKSLKKRLETINDLAETQFRFRRARSTTDTTAMIISTAKKAINTKSYNDYCLIVTVDVKIAFNTANWLNIVNALKAVKTPGHHYPGFFQQQSSHIWH